MQTKIPIKKVSQDHRNNFDLGDIQKSMSYKFVILCDYFGLAVKCSNKFSKSCTH